VESRDELGDKEPKEPKPAPGQNDIALSNEQGGRVTAAVHCHPMARHRNLSMPLEGWHTLMRERLLVDSWLFPAEIVDFCSLLRLQMEIKKCGRHGGFRARRRTGTFTDS
jgi:hypothetical protein